MIKFLASLATLALAVHPLSAQSLEGEYQSASQSSTGASTGKVSIKKDSDVYQITWAPTGGESLTGPGILSGNVLAAAFGKGPLYGLVVYKVSGGKLTGQSVMAGASGLGSEILEGPADLDGRYKIIEGKTPSGQSYAGEVSITKNGAAYALKWMLPAGVFRGVGVLEGDLLVVGWGPQDGEGKLGTVAYKVSEGKLDGKWTATDSDAVGTETLTK